MEFRALNKFGGDFWNKRYSSDDFVYGTKPNIYFKEELNKLNSQIFNTCLLDMKCGFLPSVVDGKTVLRISNTNHRTKFEDMDFLVDWIVKIGKSLT